MEKVNLILILILNILVNIAFGQTISGNLSQMTQTDLKLEGFIGIKSYTISSTNIDSNGNFILKYSNENFGIGYLITTERKPIFLILNGEDIELSGDHLNNSEYLKINKGDENKLFEQYTKEHPKREQALSAWTYLEKIYLQDTLFKSKKKATLAIQNEKNLLVNEDVSFLAELPKNSYSSWYLPIRKLVGNVPVVAQYRQNEINSTIVAFRNLDYADERLYKSGLFKDAIDSHFWLLENSGKPLDSVFVEMKISIDAMLENLVKNEQKLNEVTEYLFDLLEKHSLFEASEYLALKVLTQESCTINYDLAKQLETYRVMKKGNTAPDMIFEKSNFVNPTNTFTKLSEIKSKYTVVVFGASWCPKCNNELPQIADLYEKWKSKDIEVVFISIEDDIKAFTIFSIPFPFPSYSDLKKWDSEIVKNYYVFSTPTIFLLNNERKIILRPSSVKQLDAWVDWYLTRSNE